MSVAVVTEVETGSPWPGLESLGAVGRNGQQRHPGPRSRDHRNRRRTYFWRRVAVLLIIAALGAVAWSAGQRLVAGASVETGHGASCPASLRPVPAAAQGTYGSTASCGSPYLARPGDTVWAVAVRYSGSGDPRPLEDLLEAEIGGGVLQPGDVLVVPGGGRSG